MRFCSYLDAIASSACHVCLSLTYWPGGPVVDVEVVTVASHHLTRLRSELCLPGQSLLDLSPLCPPVIVDLHQPDQEGQRSLGWDDISWNIGLLFAHSSPALAWASDWSDVLDKSSDWLLTCAIITIGQLRRDNHPPLLSKTFTLERQIQI